MTGAYPPVPLPPIKSKRSQGSIPSTDTSDSLSQFNLCIMLLIISNCDNPRTPPPSTVQALATHVGYKTEFIPKLSILRFVLGRILQIWGPRFIRRKADARGPGGWVPESSPFFTRKTKGKNWSNLARVTIDPLNIISST